MTNQQKSGADLLGSPLSGMLWPRHWRTGIELRGRSEVLTWRVSETPSPPVELTRAFVSVPQPVPALLIKRGSDQLRQRRRGGRTDERLSPEELLAIGRNAGAQLQLVRGLPSEAQPLFGGGVLDDFITLSERPAVDLCAFAAHWGPLGLCEHGIPWTHSLVGRPMISTAPICTALGALRSKGRSGWEPLKRWREYSSDIQDITRAAIALKNRRVRPRDELDRLFRRVASWLELGGVPLVSYAEADPNLAWPCGFQASFAITGVFQIVALQLLGVVGGGRALAQCVHCGLPFVLTGHSKGPRRFCRPCREHKVPYRYASRDYRTRQGEGRA